MFPSAITAKRSDEPPRLSPRLLLGTPRVPPSRRPRQSLEGSRYRPHSPWQRDQDVEVSLNRYAQRRDANEKSLMQVMAQLGIWFIPRVGPCDGWAFYKGRWVCVEIKTPRGRNTKSQKEFMAECDLLGAPYQLWREPDDIVRFANGS